MGITRLTHFQWWDHTSPWDNKNREVRACHKEEWEEEVRHKDHPMTTAMTAEGRQGDPQDLPGHRPDHQVGRMEGRRAARHRPGRMEGRQRPGHTSHNKTDYLQFVVNCNYHHTIREKGLRA